MARQFKPIKTTKARKTQRHTSKTCQGKVRYRDKREATSALQRIGNHSGRGTVPRRAYYCAGCKGWHLTSRDDLYGQVG